MSEPTPEIPVAPDLIAPEPSAWSQVYESRREVQRTARTIWQVPLRRRWSDVLLQETAPGAAGPGTLAAGSLLDVGAGDRRLAQWWARERPGAEYRSLDLDPAGGHDYHHLRELDRDFEALCALEWVEHLGLAEAESAVAGLAEHLRPGGVMVLSTPNVYYPPAYLRDCTHRTPFCYDELGGLMLRAGLEDVRCYRLHQEPWVWKLLRRGLLAPLHRMLGIDFARQIAVVGRRPGGEAD